MLVSCICGVRISIATGLVLARAIRTKDVCSLQDKRKSETWRDVGMTNAAVVLWYALPCTVASLRRSRLVQARNRYEPGAKSFTTESRMTLELAQHCCSRRRSGPCELLPFVLPYQAGRISWCLAFALGFCASDVAAAFSPQIASIYI